MPSIYGVMRSHLAEVLPQVDLQESLAKASAEITGAIKQAYSVSLQAFHGSESKKESNDDQFYREATRQIAAVTTKPSYNNLKQQVSEIVDNKARKAGQALVVEKSNLLMARISRVLGLIFTSIVTGGAGVIGAAIGGPLGAITGTAGAAAGLGLMYAVYKKDSEKIAAIQAKIEALEVQLTGLQDAQTLIANDIAFQARLNTQYTTRGTSIEERLLALIADLNSGQ